MKLLNYILIIVYLSLCAHSVHLNYVSDFSPTYQGYTSGKIVKARTDQFVILGFAKDTSRMPCG